MNNRHRKTLDAIFIEPALSNIAWSDIESLLIAVGAQRFEGNGLRVRFLLNDVKATPFTGLTRKRKRTKVPLFQLKDFLKQEV